MTIRRPLYASLAALLSMGLSFSVFFNFASADLSHHQQNLYHHGSEPGVNQHVTADKSNDDEGSSPSSWQGLNFVIHRNGEPNSCGIASSPPIDYFLATLDLNSKEMNKYDVETFLTMVFSKTLDGPACATLDNATAPQDLLHFCDLGPDRTPVLLDHDKLVRLPEGSLPCRWYTREGLRITSLEQLLEMSQVGRISAQTCSTGNEAEEECTETDSSSSGGVDLHLYGVPAGRVFMFAPKYVGEIFELNHISDIPNPKTPIYLEVLSLDPRVFDIYNYFSTDEADDIVQRALAETSPSHRMHRSTTGTSSIFKKRTSENAFDTHGTTALAVKKRCFELLGFDEYWDGHDDGLQVLRYNKTTAYTAHMDYMTDSSGKELFNYDSAGKGGNRFATILLYMTDIPENGGGETVFSEAWPPTLPPSERKSQEESLQELRASGDAEAVGIQSGSWEEEMVAQCRSKFSVRPWRGRAVLFYSMHPNGEKDEMSKHGGCPVLHGEKWAANLWVWNTPRGNYPGQPLREDRLAEGHETSKYSGPPRLYASFKNLDRNPALKEAELWYDEAMFWGKLGHGETLNVNTYEGHRWNLRVGDEVVKRWVINSDKRQVYEV